MLRKSHYFFSAEKSPWPLLSSLCSFNLLFSATIFMKFFEVSGIIISIVAISFSRFFWWVNYSKEFNSIGAETEMLVSALKFRIILFIGREVFFFFSFFWGYFHGFFRPTLENGFLFPPANLEFFDFSRVPMINTLLLVSSGAMVTARHERLIKGHKRLFNIFLLAGVLLGVMFTGCQVVEYCNSQFRISDSMFGTCFFVLTGFHGIHVVVGTTFLVTALILSMKIAALKRDFIRFELRAWYWHFVDVVWMFLFYLVYFINY